MKNIILASNSPRRHELLLLLDIPHEIIPCQEEEKKLEMSKNHRWRKAKTIEKIAVDAARQKVLCVLKTLPDEKKKDTIIIGADTIVVLNREIIGKPKSKNEAIHMLKKILGQVHLVYTGLCLLDVNDNIMLTAVERTHVSMKEWNDNKINSYVNAEEVLDKAGAYAIQGIGAAMIEKIEGCYYNVMGLPLSRLVSLLEELGVDYFSLKS